MVKRFPVLIHKNVSVYFEYEYQAGQMVRIAVYSLVEIDGQYRTIRKETVTRIPGPEDLSAAGMEVAQDMIKNWRRDLEKWREKK